jgi:hypothetical protein
LINPGVKGMIKMRGEVSQIIQNRMRHTWDMGCFHAYETNSVAKISWN